MNQGHRPSIRQVLPWLGIATVSVGVLVILYVRDEVPVSAPLLMLAAFALGSLDLVWPRTEMIGDFFFRSLAFGVAVETSDVLLDDATFDALSALIFGAAFGLLTALWDYLRDPEPAPEVADMRSSAASVDKDTLGR